jgi:hypothetical protein
MAPAVALQKLSSRAGPGTPSLPRRVKDKLSQWLRALAPPRLVPGGRSWVARVLIGGCTVASSPLRSADDHCRHPPSKLCRGATPISRCNPTMTLSDVQYAVRVWGCWQGLPQTIASQPLLEHAGTGPTRCRPHPSCTSQE